MNTALKLAKRVARTVLPKKLIPRARHAAIRAGWVEPAPFQYPFIRYMQHHPLRRPNYHWGTLCAAELARNLGFERISVIEFGVAGGNGLLDLERIARHTSDVSGVQIDVYGFDTGSGLTGPRDYRDLPQLWREGFYSMDVPALQRRLTTARLILGSVEETVPKFIAQSPAPVGFVSFDMDMYHPTVAALQLFRADLAVLLPRVVCYFDDIIAFSHSDFNGERLAIAEFNQAAGPRRLSKIYGLRYALERDHVWTEMMYMMHALDHPRYCDFDGSNIWRELPLVAD